MIEVKELRKTFVAGTVGTHALDGVSFSIKAREHVAVIGESGSGKTTLLKTLGLIQKPDSGTVEMFGKEVFGISASKRRLLRRDRLGYVFQDYRLLPLLNALENVAVPLRLQGMKSKQALDVAHKALVRVGLSSRANHYPAQLSGGQQQRVGVARAIVHHPDVLLADEPTGNLDDENAEAVMRLLLDRESGAGFNGTVIYVTHSQKLASLADRYIRLNHGVVCEDDI